jgi:hypothetical protein
MELRSPVQEHLKDYAAENAKTRPLIVVLPDLYKGQTLALCGAGPSLASSIISGADHVWAANSALPYLVARGVRVSAGVGIDQTPTLIHEWRDAPPIPYYLASTVDPALVRHVQARGGQPIFWHSAVGFEDEFEFYCQTWPPCYLVGQGHTVISRTISLARWMGFDRVDVYGADCAFGAGDVTHANGTTAEDAYRNPMVMEGEIDGRVWRTRADMLMAAVELARWTRDSEGAIRLIGDTLPNALLGKDDAFLDLVCRKLAPGERAEPLT